MQASYNIPSNSFKPNMHSQYQNIYSLANCKRFNLLCRIKLSCLHCHSFQVTTLILEDKKAHWYYHTSSKFFFIKSFPESLQLHSDTTYEIPRQSGKTELIWTHYVTMSPSFMSTRYSIPLLKVANTSHGFPNHKAYQIGNPSSKQRQIQQK